MKVFVVGGSDRPANLGQITMSVSRNPLKYGIKTQSMYCMEIAYNAVATARIGRDEMKKDSHFLYGGSMRCVCANTVDSWYAEDLGMRRLRHAPAHFMLAQSTSPAQLVKKVLPLSVKRLNFQP